MIVWALWACADPPEPERPPAVARAECHRCHEGPWAPAAQERSCVDCHTAILAGELDRRYKPDAVARWKQRIVHLLELPDLHGARRLRRDWVEGFLRQPHDVRPGLMATMPTLPLTDAEVGSLAELLVPVPHDPAPPTGDPARGATVFDQHGCGACHRFEREAVAPDPLAPDLRHTRARMTAGAVDAFLQDPAAWVPETRMPRPALDEGSRRDLVAYLLLAELPPPPSAPLPDVGPSAERKPTYAEVEARVLKAVCWHCHSDPVPVGGDGGPGNTGGFGFAGVGLDLSSEASLRRGGHRDGSGLDVLALGPGGQPLLVEVLWARHAEVRGLPAPVRGMPLGLPPLPVADIQLVEAWVASALDAEGGADP